MYKKLNIWDEDKLDIHSSGSSGYAGNRSDDKGAGYAGHSSKDSTESYHKNETYSTNKSDEDKIKDSYRSNEKDEEKKKEDEKKEKTIVDTVEQEEKYQKEEEQEEEFKTIAKSIGQGNINDERAESNEGKDVKKKSNKSIEEAIKDAIKEEKEIVHVD